MGWGFVGIKLFSAGGDRRGASIGGYVSVYIYLGLYRSSLCMWGVLGVRRGGGGVLGFE